MIPRPLLGAATLVVAVSVATTAMAGHVEVDSLPSSTTPPLPERPQAVPPGVHMEKMRWEAANPDFGTPLTLLSDAPGCMVPGDDAPPAVVAKDDGSSTRPQPVQDAITFGDDVPRVAFFRHEVVVGEGEDAKFVIDRGVYDRRTQGVRAVDHLEVPLAVLSTTPPVYGYRADGMIDVVVPVLGLVGMTTRDPEGRGGSIGCTHARVAVPLDGSGTAIVAAFVSTPSDVRFAGRVDPGRLQIALSVSHASRDPAPWVSLAIGVVR
jgi:hypothetical protein